MSIANIKATGIPDTLEQYQLALDCAVAAGQAAALAKLRGGVEVPEPAYIWHDNPEDDCDNEMFEVAHVGLVDEGNLYPDGKCKHCTRLFTIDQLLQYGAAQRLAGRERETCTWTEQDDKDMPGTYESSCGEMWSFTDGGVKENRVTYCHHCGGKVVSASPQEQQP